MKRFPPSPKSGRGQGALESQPLILMPVLPYASLEDVRHAIRNRHLVAFTHRKIRYQAEPHLLGNAQKTHALVLVAYGIKPEEGWKQFRYSEIRDFEVLREHFQHARNGFPPHDRRITEVDTMVGGLIR